MHNLIEFYGKKTKYETDQIRIRLNSPFASTGMGIIGNTNYVFTHSEDTNAIAGGVAFRLAEDKAASGNGMDIRQAELRMGEFHGFMKILAVECNRQHGGTTLPANEVKLESTGLTLAKEGEEVGQMDKPIIASIKSVPGIAGRAEFNIRKSTKFCHGTHVQIKVVSTGVVTDKHTRLKHIFPIDGYIHNVDYMNRVAYDGTDETLVWSDWFPFPEE